VLPGIGWHCLGPNVGEACADEGAEATARRAAAPALGQLLLVKPEQLDELGGRLEGVGDRATRAERERRKQPRIGLGNEGRAVEGLRAVERRQPSKIQIVGGEGLTDRDVLHESSVEVIAQRHIGHSERLRGADPLLRQVEALPAVKAGLCDSCRHQRIVRNTRGSVFSMCERSKTDERYPKYPRLPVERCAGYEDRRK